MSGLGSGTRKGWRPRLWGEIIPTGVGTIREGGNDKSGRGGGGGRKTR